MISYREQTFKTQAYLTDYIKTPELPGEILFSYRFKDIVLSACINAARHNHFFTISQVMAEVQRFHGYESICSDGSVSARMRDLTNEGELIRIKPGVYALP